MNQSKTSPTHTRPVSMWDQTESLVQKHEQGRGNWLRLSEDGAKEVVVFLGEPYPREVCFVEGRYEAFTESHQAQGLKPTLRINFNVAMVDTQEIKVLEQGVMFLKDLIEVRKKYGLEAWAFEIKRHGTGKETRYSILPERQLSVEEQAAFSSLSIIDLKAFYEGAEMQADFSDTQTASFIHERTAEELSERLRALPKQGVTAFCQRFGVSRVKEIQKAQAEEAFSFLSSLETTWSASPTQDENDPFA